MRQNVATAASKVAGAKGSACASPPTKTTPAARALPVASIGALMSTPTTARTLDATSRAATPVPAPRSRTVSPPPSGRSSSADAASRASAGAMSAA
ncbi:MAG: hypothetical protein M5R40_01740 [Anaerolineae bacterium]|nr:hypothetical protein [Anaerolineae bacterium]